MGDEIIDLFLQWSSDRLELTETIEEAAVENTERDERILELFRTETRYKRCMCRRGRFKRDTVWFSNGLSNLEIDESAGRKSALPFAGQSL